MENKYQPLTDADFEEIDRQEAIEKRVKDLHALAKKFDQLFALREFEDCLMVGTGILEESKILGADKSLSDSVHLQMGNIYLTLGDYSHALLSYGFSGGDHQLASYLNQGYCYFLQKDFLKAGEMAAKALEIDLGMAAAMYLFGASAWSFGEKDTASLYFRKAIKQDEENGAVLGIDAHGYFVRGLVMGWLKRDLDAMADFDYCIHLCNKTKDETLKSHAVRLFQKLREKQKTAIVDGLG